MNCAQRRRPGKLSRRAAVRVQVCLRENFDDGLVDGGLGDETDDLLGDLAALEDQEGGDTADAVAHGRGSVAVNVHFHDFEFAVILVGNLVNDRGESATGTAPGSPKIYQYGLGRLENIFFKVGIVYFGYVLTCHLTSSRLLYTLYTHMVWRSLHNNRCFHRPGV